MALNPEKVADLLFVPLNRDCVGNWYRSGDTPRRIEEKATARTTTPDSFVWWLLSNSVFQWRKTLNMYEYRKSLVALLEAADETVISPEIQTMKHSVLYIESESRDAPYVKDIILHNANKKGIKSENVTVTYRERPSENINLFLSMLKSNTGAIIHNLAVQHLRAMILDVEQGNLNPQNIFIIKEGGTTSDTHRELYEKLEDVGFEMDKKPCSMDGAALVALHLV